MASGGGHQRVADSPKFGRERDFMRIGFLFNHDQIHQVAHSLPVAIALAGSDYAGEIIVATTTDTMAAEVRRLAGHLLGTRIQHVELHLSSTTSRFATWLNKFVPANKLLIYRDNLEFFRSLNMLVVAEKTSLLLKTQYGLNDLFMVHTRHGAGDRAIGFDKASSGFDHILCSGDKIRRRLIDEAHIVPEKISVVGYPKFDLIADHEAPRRFFGDKQTIIYNPHPSPHLSSWFRHGRAVLDYFVKHPDQGLIFAPHVMLFDKRYVVTVDKFTIDRPGQIENRYLRGDNIHVDLGSRASTDMTYTAAADIYLGDASSQVYEFLYQPRPCIFLNSYGADWQNDINYTHWHLGEVIDHPGQLGDAIARAPRLHREKYLTVQQALFEDSFDLTETPSAQRAASVIQKISASL
jgi:hypothetical protein